MSDDPTQTPTSDDPTQTARPETSLDARPEPSRGVAPIKAEYLLNPTPVVETVSSAALNNLDDDAAEGRDARDARDRGGDGGSNKRRKTGKKERGQNKHREFPRLQEATRVCRSWELAGMCDRADCRFAHGWQEYFASKLPDLHHEPAGVLVGYAPFVQLGARDVGGDDVVGKTIDLATTCPVYKDLGFCTLGWRCRFLGGHVRRVEDEAADSPTRVGHWELLGRPSASDAGDADIGNGKWKNDETNWVEHRVLSLLRSGKYDFPFSRMYLARIEPDKPFTLGQRAARAAKPAPAAEVAEEDAMNAEEAATSGRGVVDGEAEAIDVPFRPEEKRRLNWEGGLYLAPLTTTGNLPFRRLCATYGATITCCEMSLAQPVVSGADKEWALVRRHRSEGMFGIQLAGGYANRMVPAAEVIAKQIGDGVDFVDVNLGCPIDLVFNQGAGSALMDSPGRLGKLLVGMNRALGEIPLTVKFRTGVAAGKPNAHKLIPRFATEWGASAMTLHGRSRQQRYSKLADWAYIKQCCTTLRETLADAGLPPVPMFGNGDCFSAQGYYEEKEGAGVDGVMVARGALIKPWIFTEIAERREWDISATERLDGIRKFAEFGLSHWGSDTVGINTTRRFLCEALSFQHRYIPLGLLERLPGKLNERPPAYQGRNELETLLASPYAGDWVKISEMFLGPTDESFAFVPKHKSNAYGGEEAQG
ncbi:tRNA-dihydrouridine synthase 3 [Cryptotrichosporon argae]